MPRKVNRHPYEQSDALPMDRIEKIVLPAEMEELLPPEWVPVRSPDLA